MNYINESTVDGRRWTVDDLQRTVNGGQRTAHIWLVDLGNELAVNQCFKLISEDEKERASKFRFEKDRSHFIIARGVLRQILSLYLSEKPNIIQFKYGKYGKPFLPKNILQFNLSHAGEIALIGLTKNHKVGIDVEVINRKVEVERVAQHFFAKGEIDSLMSLPETQRHEAFFNCWTRKEAFIKAIGDGLSFPLDQFEVTLKPDEKAELLATYFNEKERDKWSLFDLKMKEGYKAALAIKGKIEEIKYFDWTSRL